MTTLPLKRASVASVEAAQSARKRQDCDRYVKVVGMVAMAHHDIGFQLFPAR